MIRLLAYNTGLRRRSLFTLRMEWIDWNKRRITIPPRAMKSRRKHVAHLNETAYSHLLAIRTDRELSFPGPSTGRASKKAACPVSTRPFTACRTPPASPRPQHFGLHALRKTLATILWEESPQAAQYALGHSGMGITRDHYVAGQDMLARALDQVPQPAAFAGVQSMGNIARPV